METQLEESQRTSIIQESMTRDERDHFTRQIESHQDRADELGIELERAREEIAGLKIELAEKSSSLSEAVGSSMALKAGFENELDSLKEQNETLMHRMGQIQRDQSVEISECMHTFLHPLRKWEPF
jgi:predicted  nucleic acid-binding Zn-ribbon protein